MNGLLALDPRIGSLYVPALQDVPSGDGSDLNRDGFDKMYDADVSNQVQAKTDLQVLKDSNLNPEIGRLSISDGLDPKMREYIQRKREERQSES